MASPALIFLILMMSSLSRAVYGVILDVRLVNGSKPNEGTIMYTEDCLTWHTSCGQANTDINEADVICRHLGYPATNLAIQTSPFGVYGSPSTQIKCNGDEKNIISECNVTECTSGTPGGVTCYETNYIGCFIDNKTKRVLNHSCRNINFTGLTIDRCLNFCRQHNSMVFAGVENSNECYCSNDPMANLTINGQRAPDHECNFECHGSKYERCGGLNRIAIFNLSVSPRLSPYPMDSPCDTTTPPRISTMSSEVTEIVQVKTSQVNPASTQGLRTSDMSEDGSNTPSGSSAFTETVSGPDRTSSSTSRTPNATPYGAIGGGVAVVVGVIVVIIIIVMRRKSKEKEDQKCGVCEMTKTTSESPGYESSIVGFHDATDGDTTDDLHGVIEKDAFSAQMQRGTMIVDYVNLKGKAGNTPAVAEPDHSYENMTPDTTGNDAMTSKDVGGSDELYAIVTCGTR